LEIDSLFRAVFEGFLQNLQKTPSKKGISLGSQLCWSRTFGTLGLKENEQDNTSKKQWV